MPVVENQCITVSQFIMSFLTGADKYCFVYFVYKKFKCQLFLLWGGALNESLKVKNYILI